MKLDTYIQLINDLRTASITDDVDPQNVLLETFQTPFDAFAAIDSIRTLSSAGVTLVWSDGSTYLEYDSNGNPYDAPSCGWVWGAGGRWG